jgi:ureidoacrylate peracid hydrolase
MGPEITPVAGFAPTDKSGTSSVVLPARPEALKIKPAETAVIVVDMQNAYASKGGYVDLAGFDISGAEAAIEQTRKVLDAARAAGCTVIYFQNGWDKDYVEAGGPGSPNWYKSNALKTMRARPELAGTLLAKGTWDYAIVDSLAPQAGDVVIPKTRYSGFFNTNIDSVLRARHTQSGLYRHCHQCVRRVLVTRRVPSRIFRSRDRRCHASSRP